MLGQYGRAGVDIKSEYNKEKWFPLLELPIPISASCCGIMKKAPSHKYAKDTGRKPFIATLAEESRLRKQAWLRTGCNAFDKKFPSSQPMSFWTEQDVLHYIKREGIEIASPYGEIVYTDEDGNDSEFSLDFDAPLHCTGCSRTGCVYCCFGAHSKKDKRFIELAKISPRQYEYAMEGGQWVDNPKYDASAPVYDGEWKNWNPKKIWVPSKKGLGLRYVIEQFNIIYPDNKIKLE